MGKSKRRRKGRCKSDIQHKASKSPSQPFRESVNGDLDHDRLDNPTARRLDARTIATAQASPDLARTLQARAAVVVCRDQRGLQAAGRVPQWTGLRSAEQTSLVSPGRGRLEQGGPFGTPPVG